jgi:hypothetical protein
MFWSMENLQSTVIRVAENIGELRFALAVDDKVAAEKRTAMFIIHVDGEKRKS